MNAFTIGLLIVIGLVVLTALVQILRPTRSTLARRHQDVATAEAEYKAGPRGLPPYMPGGM